MSASTATLRLEGSAALAGAVMRAGLLPANSRTVVASGQWDSNWADWDNSGGYNEWEDWSPSPPGG